MLLPNLQSQMIQFGCDVLRDGAAECRNVNSSCDEMEKPNSCANNMVMQEINSCFFA